MSLRSRIETTFGAHACSDAVFFAAPIGLRFALAKEGAGSSADHAALATRDALRICREIFDSEGLLVDCLKTSVVDGVSELEAIQKKLQSLGVSLGSPAEVWRQACSGYDNSEMCEVGAFHVPAAEIRQLLWHAITADLGTLRSGPSAGVYLFNIPRGIAAHPYDDRGMDVFGPNGRALKDLGERHGDLLLQARVEEVQ